MSKDQQDEPVCRKPAQQDHRKVDRGPVTPDAQKRASASELGNAIIEVLEGDGKLLADTVKNGALFYGDTRDMAVFEKIRTNCVPKLDWSHTVVTPTKNNTIHLFMLPNARKQKSKDIKNTNERYTFYMG